MKLEVVHCHTELDRPTLASITKNGEVDVSALPYGEYVLGLGKKDSLPNPASTRQRIYGPQAVRVWVNPSGIDVRVENPKLVG